MWVYGGYLEYLDSHQGSSARDLGIRFRVWDFGLGVS